MMNWKFWQRRPMALSGDAVQVRGKRYFLEPGVSVSGMGTGRGNGAVVSCVGKIVSRALEIPFASTDPSVQRVLNAPSWLRSVDTAKFWERLYETALYDGEVVVFRTSGGLLRLGMTSGSPIFAGDGEQRRISRDVLTRTIGDQDEETVRVEEPDLCRIRWSDSADRPWAACSRDAMAYAELVDDLYQEGRYARRVTDEIAYDDSFTNKDAAEEKLAEMDGVLKNGRKHQTVTFMKGMHYQPRHPGSSPPHDVRITQALAGVARVYGVPLQMLGVSLAKRELSIDEADAHLLRDAVMPLARKVASGLTKVFGRPVEVDMRKVGLPSRTGVAGLMMQLSQTGVLTVDEIREQVGFAPIGDERGSEFPQTAGAGDREGNGQEPNNEDQT